MLRLWSGLKNTRGAIQEPLRNELSQNKSFRFQLQYIEMQLNQPLSVANIIENRYTWVSLSANWYNMVEIAKALTERANYGNSNWPSGEY